MDVMMMPTTTTTMIVIKNWKIELTALIPESCWMICRKTATNRGIRSFLDLRRRIIVKLSTRPFEPILSATAVFIPSTSASWHSVSISSRSADTSSSSRMNFKAEKLKYSDLMQSLTWRSCRIYRCSINSPHWNLKLHTQSFTGQP